MPHGVALSGLHRIWSQRIFAGGDKTTTIVGACLQIGCLDMHQRPKLDVQPVGEVPTHYEIFKYCQSTGRMQAQVLQNLR